MKNEEKADDICAKYGVSKLIPTEEECIAYNAALEMAEWKDEQLPHILLRYTKWLEKRGAFCSDLCVDWTHQIETFLEYFNCN